jgi:hypothetical protein
MSTQNFAQPALFLIWKNAKIQFLVGFFAFLWDYFLTEPLTLKNQNYISFESGRTVLSIFLQKIISWEGNNYIISFRFHLGSASLLSNP